MRKYINIILGIVIIALAFWIVKVMINSNKKPDRAPTKIVKTVFIENVKNREIPITISANGNLVAKNKIEIFSEVQGVLEPTPKEFRAGNAYKKGEVILKLNSEEHYANLQAQKSNLYNSITSIMPDIRLDYPEAYQKWEQYLSEFDFNKTTPPLPEIDSEKEKSVSETIKRPINWGGFLVKPVKFEFWQGRESRLHDRILYEKMENGWIISRLAP